MVIFRRMVVSAFFCLTASAAWASNFRAADLVYMPAAARAAGSGGSFFKTDVTISNLSTDPVIVSVVLVEGPNGNATAPASAVPIPVLAPGERREIVDILQSVLNVSPGNHVGQLLFFACRQGGNCTDCDANSADCKLIAVQGRIYTEGTGASCPAAAGSNTCTFGQLFVGIPWYNFISSTSSTQGLDKAFIAGIRQIGTAGVSGFRSNIGVANASNEFNTTIRIQLFSNTGQLVGTQSINLGPLGHSQQNVGTLFPGFTGGGYVIVDQTSSTQITTTPAGQTPPVPGFFAYGSVVDNLSNDPTTLEAVYTDDLSFACVYGSKPVKRPVRKGS